MKMCLRAENQANLCLKDVSKGALKGVSNDDDDDGEKSGLC